MASVDPDKNYDVVLVLKSADLKSTKLALAALRIAREVLLNSVQQTAKLIPSNGNLAQAQDLLAALEHMIVCNTFAHNISETIQKTISDMDIEGETP